MDKKEEDKSILKTVFPKTIPVMAGYLVLGMGFGILLESKGYSFIWAAVMSLTIYAGSMQYVAVDLLSGGATLIATAIMTLMINARHLFYGISMLDKYRGTGKFKPYLIFALTDETYSLVCSDTPPEGMDKGRYYFYLSILNQCYWIAGSVIGAVIGKLIAFNSTGVDFAMTALFVVIFVDQWLSNKNHIPAIVGIVSTVVCLVVFGSDGFVIPAMIVIAVALMALRRPLSKEAE